MKQPHVELWQRLQGFEFDDPAVESRFSERLARENRWSKKFAQRVLEEYRRFLFLSVAAGHPVAPSEVVDRAWHLHLIYTESYWTEMCGRVLQRPLHHWPSKGGFEEQSKLGDWYSKTLASYERHFGEKPPADLWPRANGEQPTVQVVHIDADKYWLIPKASWRFVPSKVTISLLVCMICLVLGCVPNFMIVGPLNWRGPEFLILYGGLWVAGIVGGIALRYQLRDSSVPIEELPEFNSYEVAYLAGAEPRTILSVLTSLVARGLLRVKAGQSELATCGSMPADALPIERAAWDAVEEDGTLKALYPRLKHDAELVTPRLKRFGLVLTSADEWKVRLIPAGLMVILLMFGVAKVAIGIDRGRSVGFLSALCAFTFATAIFFATTRAFRSRQGDAALQGLEAKNATLKDPMSAQAEISIAAMEQNAEQTIDSVRGGRAAEVTLPMAVALFGPVVLSDGPFDDLRKVFRPQNSGGCSSGCSSSCGGGGGGCGGGGGGCGGCGGGGD